jgi:hypothetical protein
MTTGREDRARKILVQRLSGLFDFKEEVPSSCHKSHEAG